MKTYDPNNMVIDYVFKRIDKKRKRKELEEEQALLASKQSTSENDGYYTIEINM